MTRSPPTFSSPALRRVVLPAPAGPEGAQEAKKTLDLPLNRSERTFTSRQSLARGQHGWSGCFFPCAAAASGSGCACAVATPTDPSTARDEERMNHSSPSIDSESSGVAPRRRNELINQERPTVRPPTRGLVAKHHEARLETYSSRSMGEVVASRSWWAPSRQRPSTRVLRYEQKGER
jgi:hypothetical protein